MVEAPRLTSRGIDRWGFPLPPPKEIALVKPQEEAQPASKPPALPKQKGFGSFSPELDEGLRRLCARQRPFQTFTRTRIAQECGVSRDTIRLLERQALRRVYKLLGPDFSKQAKEFLSQPDRD